MVVLSRICIFNLIGFKTLVPVDLLTGKKAMKRRQTLGAREIDKEGG